MARKPLFDPADLRDNPGGYTCNIRSKDVCLTMTDWASLSDALAHAYPAGRYLAKPSCELRRTPNVPAITPKATLRDALSPQVTYADGIDMCLDPAWQLRWHRNDDAHGRPWIMDHVPYPFIWFRPNSAVRPHDRHGPERIMNSEIHVYCERGNKAHRAFSARFFRLFSQIATNAGLIGVRWPEYRIVYRIAKGGHDWVGHDAIRWVREDPRRLLHYWPMPVGLRPDDGDAWQPPV